MIENGLELLEMTYSDVKRREKAKLDEWMDRLTDQPSGSRVACRRLKTIFNHDAWTC